MHSPVEHVAHVVFDTAEQGEGFNDIGTHLVDLVQWTLFPTQTIDYRADVRILAAQRFPSRIYGDESLSRRPMERIMRPLTEMGAKIEARDGRFPPLTITGATIVSCTVSLTLSPALCALLLKP